MTAVIGRPNPTDRLQPDAVTQPAVVAGCSWLIPADPAQPVQGRQGRQASRGGDSRKAFPWRQAKRAAPQARRREGLKPNGRDSAAGTGPSPKARRRKAQARHTVLVVIVSTHLEAGRHGQRSSDDVAFMPCCESSTAPRRSGGALGGRQAAWGLLRDQISVCVPSSSSISRA